MANERIRNYPICPVCYKPKERGLVTCWRCYYKYDNATVDRAIKALMNKRHLCRVGTGKFANCMPCQNDAIIGYKDEASAFICEQHFNKLVLCKRNLYEKKNSSWANLAKKGREINMLNIDAIRFVPASFDKWQGRIRGQGFGGNDYAIPIEPNDVKDLRTLGGERLIKTAQRYPNTWRIIK